jgi:hypothetical protein
MFRWTWQSLVVCALFMPPYAYLVSVMEWMVTRGAQLFLAISDIQISRLADGGWSVHNSVCADRCDVAFGSRLFSAVVCQPFVVLSAITLGAPMPTGKRMKMWTTCMCMFLTAVAGSLAACSYLLGTLCTRDTTGHFCRSVAGILSPWSQILAAAVVVGVAAPRVFASQSPGLQRMPRALCRRPRPSPR